MLYTLVVFMDVRDEVMDGGEPASRIHQPNGVRCENAEGFEMLVCRADRFWLDLSTMAVTTSLL